MYARRRSPLTRVSQASQVIPHGGLGLGLPTTTDLPTRQPDLTRRGHYQLVPIDWRPQGSDRSFSARQAEPQGATTDDCGCS